MGETGEWRDTIIPCECKGHALSVSTDSDGTAYLMFLSAYNEGDSLWERIKLTWRILRTGRSECGDVVLSQDNRRRLVNFLAEFK